VDLRWSREVLFNRCRLTAYLDLINVTGARNVAGYTYNEDYSQRERVTQLPFLPSIGVRVTF
jgi:hypothetical protein